MSIQYHKEIHPLGDLTLQVNFSGIKNGTTTQADLKMSFYVFDKFGTPKFSETLEYTQIKNQTNHYCHAFTNASTLYATDSPVK